jgi:hypothetical protein
MCLMAAPVNSRNEHLKAPFARAPSTGTPLQVVPAGTSRRVQHRLARAG